MKLGIAKAYNGEHRIYKKNSKELGIDSFLFDIDKADWLSNLKETDAYLWHADSKKSNYRVIHDRIYFIEEILKRSIFPDMNMYFSFGDKIKENDILKYNKVLTPKTYITYKKEKALSIIKNIKYPFVLKDAHGYGGRHVKKINNQKEARVLINKIFSSKGFQQGNKKQNHSLMKDYFFAQEFVSVEKDLRVIIIGEKIVCAYWRESEDWKNNIGTGGKASFENISKKALKMCLNFHKKMKFHWMSYDVFVLPDGTPLMNEFSCNFGIKAPTEAGYEIRKMQIEYIKKYLNQYEKNKK